MVKNLIAKIGLSDQQIMDAAEVKTSYVRESVNLFYPFSKYN